MDGFDVNDRVIVIAATNMLDNLDPALIRPGRFDRKVEVKLPNALERKQILAIHLRNKNNSLNEMDIAKAATFLDGCSGAEIENLVNLIALQSVRKHKKSAVRNGPDGSEASAPIINKNDLVDAVDVFMREKSRVDRS